MTKSTLSSKGLPGSQLLALANLGKRIRTARKRRGITLAELAARMLVSVKTLRNLEYGEPGVSLAVFVSALFCLELAGDLEPVAAMETDQLGQFLERQRLERMPSVRKRKNTKLDF